MNNTEQEFLLSKLLAELKELKKYRDSYIKAKETIKGTEREYNYNYEEDVGMDWVIRDTEKVLKAYEELIACTN